MSISPRPERRRDTRIDIHIPLTLIWVDDNGKEHRETTQTESINAYGCLFYAKLNSLPGTYIDLMNLSTKSKSTARVIWCGETDAEGRTYLGVELTANNPDFWGKQVEEEQKKSMFANTWVD